MNAAEGRGSVFAVEVVETVSTLYRVRAIDEDQAGQIATAHNIAAGAHGGSVVVCERDALVRPPNVGDDYLPILDTSTSTSDPDTAPVPPGPGVAAVLVVVRDPDAPTQVSAYTADGAVVELAEVVVDPGWGWTRTEWDEARADAMASVPESVRGVVAGVYAAYAGSRYIIGDGGDQ